MDESTSYPTYSLSSMHVKNRKKLAIFIGIVMPVVIFTCSLLWVLEGTKIVPKLGKRVINTVMYLFMAFTVVCNVTGLWLLFSTLDMYNTKKKWHDTQSVSHNAGYTTYCICIELAMAFVLLAMMTCNTRSTNRRPLASDPSHSIHVDDN